MIDQTSRVDDHATTSDSTTLAALYRHRFDDAELPRKDAIWRVLCRDFFQKFIVPDATVLDLACGYGEFTRNIQANRKIAVDLNPDSPLHLPDTTEFHAMRADRIRDLGESVVDHVFTSNFLEHLPDKAALDGVLESVMHVLKPGGTFLILGPNLRYLAGQYWDFYDHHLGLTHLSLSEAMHLQGFEVEKVYPRFLPYTTQGALPTHPLLVKLYLKIPLAWPLLGKQFFLVGRKPA